MLLCFKSVPRGFINTKISHLNIAFTHKLNHANYHSSSRIQVDFDINKLFNYDWSKSRENMDQFYSGSSDLDESELAEIAKMTEHPKWLPSDHFAEFKNVPPLDPTKDDIRNEEDWWRKFLSRFDDKKSFDEDEADDDKDEEIELPYEQLLNNPLPQEPKKVDAYIVLKQVELMEKYTKQGDYQQAFDEFLTMRIESIVPPASAYELIIPNLVNWGDFQAYRLLKSEMNNLKYEPGPRVIYADVYYSMIFCTREEHEEVWNSVVENKFDLDNHICSLRLIYYAQILKDIPAAEKWFQKMRELRKIDDVSPYNIMMDTYYDYEMFDDAKRIYADMEKDGLTTLDPTKAERVRYGGRDVFVSPLQMGLRYTLFTMINIYAMELDEKNTTLFLSKLDDIQRTLMPGQLDPYPFPPPFKVLPKILPLYVHYGKFDVARKFISFMTDNDVIVPDNIIKALFIALAKKGETGEFLLYESYFNNFFVTIDQETSSEILKMWYRAKDYKRAKNVFDAMEVNGLVPDDDGIEAMMQVYTTNDEQIVVTEMYEELVRAGRKVTQNMYNLTILGYLNAGYPSSAKDVWEKMNIEKHEMSPEVLHKMVEKYAQSDGIKYALNLIETHMTSPDTKYPIMAEDILNIVKNCTSETRQTARDTWNRFHTAVTFSLDSIQDLVKAYSKLNDSETIMDIYNYIRDESTLKDNLTPILYETILSSGLHLGELFKVYSDMKDSKVTITPKCIVEILKECNKRAAVEEALNLTKEYVGNYLGLQYHISVLREFFVVISRNDLGRYKLEAKAWLSRIIPANTGVTYAVPMVRDPSKTLEQMTDQYLSPLLSFQVGKYILSMDNDKVLTTKQHVSNKELYEGSEADIEDILIHQYGYPAEDVRKALRSTKAEETMKKIRSFRLEE